jgi:hypothetical protein
LTSLDAVSKATRILDAVDKHAEDNCPHCLELLNNIYKKGTGPAPTSPEPTPTADVNIQRSNLNVYRSRISK